MARALGQGASHVQVLAGRFLLGTLVVIGALCGVIAVVFRRDVRMRAARFVNTLAGMRRERR